MVPVQIENEAEDFDQSLFYQNRKGIEPKKKVNKLSIRLTRMPSFKLTTTSQGRNEFDADDSPNYSKNTASSDAKKEILQKSLRNLSRRSSFKPQKSLARLSSTKYRRSLMRKSSGEIDHKKKLNKSRSIKLGNRRSIVLLSNNADKKSLSDKTMASGNQSTKSIRRTNSSRPLRILSRTTTLRTKRPSMKKSAKMLDSSIHTATCSSVLKDSKFPDHLELQPGGSESERISLMKVCHYRYCSLHGHHHADAPPLKRFISMRRRQLKSQSQKSVKFESKTSQTRKRLGYSRKEMQASKDTSNRELAVDASNGHNHVSNVDHYEHFDVDVYEDDLESIVSEANTSTGVADKVFDASIKFMPDELEESISINSPTTSGSSSEQEEHTVASEEKHEGSTQKHQYAAADSEIDFNYEAEKSQQEKPKHLGLWNLIYQHMASGISAEGETQLCLDKLEKKEQEENGNTNNLPAMNKSNSNSDYSEIDQSMDKDEQDRGSDKIRLNAIKLVQKAFDKILSEIPDQSSDDQSINIEEKKAEPATESKAEKQAPRSWSNLKKILILKRFVKTLEKVRKLNPREPRFLAVQPQPESEKVHLRPQTTGERKDSAEWMLDYALQQVISTLAPAQKTKVALLVKAFETVVPVPDSDTSPSLSAAASSKTTLVHSASSLYQKGSGNGKETKFGVVLRKVSFSDMISKEDQDQLHTSCGKEEHVPMSSSELNEPHLEQNEPSSASDSANSAASNFGSKTTAVGLKEQVGDISPSYGHKNSMVKNDEPNSINYSLEEPAEKNLCDDPSPVLADVGSTVHDEGLCNRVLQKVAEEESPLSASELHDHDVEPQSQIQQNFADCNVVCSVAASEQQQESPKATSGETMLRNKFLQVFSQQSKSSVTEEVHEKPKNMRLWYLIYKHMVSGNTNALDEGTDNEGQTDHTNKLNDSGSGQDRDNQRMELQQREAIRMVEEAIDEIQLPDAQDGSSDDKSISSDIIPSNKNYIEKHPDEEGAYSITTSTGITKKSDEEYNSTKTEQSTTTIEGNKPKQQTRKSWSHLKKLVLLQRFVKAVEKVNVTAKPFNPRKPRFLPLSPEEEAEKVKLRHQETDDRKNADEWMLDYALQNAVAKLTPARKRKVQLLVEAFETVIPTLES